MFSLVSGIALLVASVAAGALWDAYGSATTFLAGGVFALLTLAALLGLGVGPGARRRHRSDRRAERERSVATLAAASGLG